jgi:short-subunit dehydrogenase
MDQARKKFSACTTVAFGAAGAGAIAWAVRKAVRRRRRIDFTGRTVLISGASRGLGLELARGFAAEGADLILIARDPDKLERAAIELRRAGVDVQAHALDVGDRNMVRDKLAAIFAQGRAIDVLVNNAGTIQVGPLDNMECDDYESAMRVHFWGPLYLMREIIPHMKIRRGGRIVNIASIGGKVAVPHLSPYAASKFALVGLSTGMRAELLKDGIYVTTVSPGLMRTGSHFNAYFKGQHRKEFALFALANASPLLSTTSSQAAEKIIGACRYGRAELVITPQAQLLRLASSLFPGVMAETFALVGRVLPKSPGPNGDRAKLGSESRSLIAPSMLTRMADKAAPRNNEIAETQSAAHGFAGRTLNGGNDTQTCVCTHPTHFLGQCRVAVEPPERTCAECMESHFHRIDDPAI